MLNEEYVLKLIEPYLNSKRELSEFEFFELFSELTRREHYEIVKLLIKHDIDYVDEKDEEIEQLEIADGLFRSSESTDYKNLLHLTNEQLAVMAQSGDNAAVSALIEKNKRFIYQLVKRQQKQHPNISMTEEDLFQEGCVGVIKAIEKFDASLDYYFLTYCGNWIRQMISRNIVDSGYMIRIPVHMYEKTVKITSYRQANPLLNQTELIDLIIGTETAAEKPITPTEILKCLSMADYYLNTTSLNVFVGEAQEIELMDLLPDTETISLEEIIVDRELREVINRLLKTLTPREGEIIRARFGIETGIPLTLEAVGRIYNVTRERIRQIEAKAIRKLRHPSRAKYLKGFWEG